MNHLYMNTSVGSAQPINEDAGRCSPFVGTFLGQEESSNGLMNSDGNIFLKTVGQELLGANYDAKGHAGQKQSTPKKANTNKAASATKKSAGTKTAAKKTSEPRKNSANKKTSTPRKKSAETKKASKPRKNSADKTMHKCVACGSLFSEEEKTSEKNSADKKKPKKSSDGKAN